MDGWSASSRLSISSRRLLSSSSSSSNSSNITLEASTASHDGPTRLAGESALCLACEPRFCPSQALTAQRCPAAGESGSPPAKAVPEGHSRGRWGTRACEFSCTLRLHKLLQQGPALFWRQTKLMAYERPSLKGWFAVLIRRPARLIAQADGDLVAPFTCLHQGPIVVCGIVI